MSDRYELINRANFICKSGLRKRKSETLVMKKFVCGNGSGNYPKKEYVRCMLIRGHKKLIRNIIACKISKKGITGFNLKDRKELLNYRAFQDHMNDNIQVLEALSLTNSGPLTDGKVKREKLHNGPRLEKVENSFNNTFCQTYFSSQVCRESFVYFIKLIFTCINPENLNLKFGFWCCANTKHCLECFEKWMIMKFYLEEEMFVFLGYEKVTVFVDKNQTLPPILNAFELSSFRPGNGLLLEDAPDSLNI